MHRFNPFFLFFGILFTLAPPLSGQVTIEGVAAVVDGDIILYSEVVTLAQQDAQMQKINIAADPDKYYELMDKWLKLLIDNKTQILLAERDTTIVVFDEMVNEQVEQNLQREIQARGSAAALEKAFGASLQEIREILTKQTRENMLIQRLHTSVTQNITVSRSEVRSFFEAYKDSVPPVPTLYDISHILVRPKKLPDVVAQETVFMDSLLLLLKNGADFAELAKKYSEDPGSAAGGGDLGWTKSGEFVPEFEDAVKELSPGEISGVIQSPFGLHIIQLLERRGNEFHARHILKLLVLDESDSKRAIEKLNEYRQRVIDGEDFNELAVSVSDDPDVNETRGNIGELQLKTLSQILPEFVPVIENMQEGEISAPIKTQYGYHIVRVNKISESRPRSLAKDYPFFQNLALSKKRDEYYITWIGERKKELYIDNRLAELVPPPSQK